MSLHQQEKIVNSQTEPTPLATLLYAECIASDKNKQLQPSVQIRQGLSQKSKGVLSWCGLKTGGLLRMLTINFELKLNLIHMLSSLLKDVITLLT